MRNGVDITSTITFLRVSQLAGDTGYYVFYENERSEKLNDLSFDTIDELLRQVKSEFSDEVEELLLTQLQRYM